MYNKYYDRIIDDLKESKEDLSLACNHAGACLLRVFHHSTEALIQCEACLCNGEIEKCESRSVENR